MGDTTVGDSKEGAYAYYLSALQQIDVVRVSRARLRVHELPRLRMRCAAASRDPLVLFATRVVPRFILCSPLTPGSGFRVWVSLNPKT